MEEGTEEETKAPASERLRIADHKAPVLPLVGLGLIASALGIALGLIIDWFPVGASEQVDQVDHFYDILIIASVPVFVAVTAIVLYCVYRFKMLPGEEDMDGPPIHGNTRLEVIWTLIPAVMMLGLCVYAAILLGQAEEAPAANEPPELNVRVVGEQFTWTFFYEGEEGGEEIASNQLYLPIDRSVNFSVQTKDVLHDFWVPAFRWKIDAVPGITTSYRVTPNRIGRYPVVCAELCGLGHATMRQTATVMTGDDFAAWLEEQPDAGTTAAEAQEGEEAEGGESGGETASADGEAVFTANGCGGCHILAAAAATGQTGPSLDEALPDLSEAEISESITDPNKEIAEGYGENIMPNTYGSLPQEELDALVAYLVESTK